jgi:DNA topoisomerase VI subunit B
VTLCANPDCGNEFDPKPGRGRPQVYCKPECRPEPAKIYPAKNQDDGARFLQIGAKNKSAKLTRVAFTVSRLMEFCTLRELQNQTGHGADYWPEVATKEILDNALDACEEAEVPPVISLDVGPGSMVIQDNGPGIETGTVEAILDYSKRVSSREAYVSPTRGAQGNALKTILAMSYVLDRQKRDDRGEAAGVTVIEAHGIEHRIKFRVDHVNNQPKITHTTAPSPITVGTRVTTQWPAATRRLPSLLSMSRDPIIDILEGFTWFNPHLTLLLSWDGEQILNVPATNPDWRKWSPRDPTSPHWYDEGRLQRYLAAHVSRDRDMGRHRTVREFISEFRGLSATAVQREVLEEVGCARQSLAEFFGIDRVNRAGIASLLASMKKHSKPVAPKLLGIIGASHFRQRFLAVGGNAKTFTYQQRKGTTDEGIPYLVELAFGLHQSGLDPNAKRVESRRFIAGANWSVGINNPFRNFGSTGEGLESSLAQVRASANQPVICAAHLASAHIQYADRGKSSIILTENASQPDD